MSEISRALKSRAFIPAYFLGAALIHSWSQVTGAMYSNDSTYTLLNMLVPLVMALLWRRLSEERPQRVLIPAIAMLGALGTVLIVAGRFDGTAVLWTGVALRSATAAAFLVMWFAMLARLTLFQAAMNFACMQILALLLYGAIMAMPAETYTGLACAMPLLSGAFYYIAMQETSDRALESPDRGKPSVAADLRWRFLVAVFFIAFAYGLNQTHGDISCNIVSYGIAGALILASLVFFRRSVSLHVLLSIAVPLVVIGLFLSATLESSIPVLSTLSLDTGYALTTASFTLLLTDRSRRFGVPVIWSLGIMRAALIAGTEAGSVTMGLLENTPLNITHAVQIAFLTTAVALAVAALLWAQDRKPDDLAPMWSENEEADAEVPSEESAPQEAEAPRRDSEIIKQEILERCEKLSEEYQLSKREAEVLGYLALGWSAPRIESELVISTNTVKTHVRHIYSKLGIHSRDELKKLVGIEVM